jgi:hypothetical protein
MLSLDGGTKISEGMTVMLHSDGDGDGELNDSLFLHLECWHLTMPLFLFALMALFFSLSLSLSLSLFWHSSWSVVSVLCMQLVINTNWLFLLAALQTSFL